MKIRVKIAKLGRGVMGWETGVRFEKKRMKLGKLE